MRTILNYFPDSIVNEIEQNINNKWEDLEEIRFRVNKPIILKFNNTEKIIKKYINQENILEIMQYICDNSIYAYQEQICNGFITVQGGHRVGITGSAVIENEKVINLNYISGLNFRIAKQILGAGDNIINYILDVKNNTINNTLIVSPPGAGKTTVLKDLVRQISNGIPKYNFEGLTVGVVDERGEISATHRGIAQNDLGIRTDVIDNIPKNIGMQMLIRSMSPQVIVADEIGGKGDVDAINYAVCCGIKGIFTAHGKILEDIEINETLNKLIHTCIFENIIFLDNKIKGNIEKVYTLDKVSKKYLENKNNILEKYVV